MANNSLRWGLLSTARINRAIIPPLQASPRSELTAVASRSQAKAEAYAVEWRIPRAHGSYAALLADPEIDVIYNSLPNSLHAEWTIKAAQAGKHVLCEKPLTVTVEEADAIEAAARKAGVVVAEAFMYRHHPQTLKVRDLVAQRAIGQVRLVRGSFTYPQSRANDVRLDPALGGGSIWDVGCYPISYARCVLGAEPREVVAWQVIGSTGTDDTVVGQMRFPGDIFAQFDCSFRAHPRMRLEIVGDEGAIEVPNPFKPGVNSQFVFSRGDEKETITIPGQEPYIGEVEDMAEAVLLGRAPRVSLADSRNNVAVILALLQSAREGQPVSLGCSAVLL